MTSTVCRKGPRLSQLNLLFFLGLVQTVEAIRLRVEIFGPGVVGNGSHIAPVTNGIASVAQDITRTGNYSVKVQTDPLVAADNASGTTTKSVHNVAGESYTFEAVVGPHTNVC